MNKLIIFDFDGVLTDTFETFYPLIRDGMASIDKKLTRDEYRDFFIGNVHQGFKDFIRNEKEFKLFSKFRKTNYDRYYYGGKNKAKLFNETPKLLKLLRGKFTLTIASSGQKKNIDTLLKRAGLRNFFKLVLADSSLSKEGMIKKILNKFKAKPEEAIMITDTAGDISIAKDLGLKTIGVTWGFQSKKTLLSTKPDHISPSFENLISILKKEKGFIDT